MQNSIDQTAYQIRQYLLCAGRDRTLAENAGKSYRNSMFAADYQTYLTNAKNLNQIPEIRDELGWGDILPKEYWTPLSRDSEELLDPASSMSEMSLPMLAIYGALDKNIDPLQASAYLGSAKNSNIEVVIIPGADHNMIVGGSGCVQEQLNRYKTVPDPRRSDLYRNTLISSLENRNR